MKKTANRKRTPRGQGRLYKRYKGKEYPADSNIRAPYWLQYTKDGKRIRQSLVDADGKPIYDRKTAEEEKDHLLHPLQAANDVERKKALLALVEESESKLKKAGKKKTSPVLLSDLWECYLNAPHRPDSGPRTLRDYQSQLKRFVQWMTKEHPKKNKPRDITSKIAATFITGLKKDGATPRTITKYLRTFTLIWRVCSANAELPENIWDANHITRPKQKKSTGRRNALSLDELSKLLAHAKNTDIHDLIIIMAYSGMRLGDAVTLQWDAIDLTRGVITITPRKTARTSGKTVHIPLLPAAREMLTERNKTKSQVHVFPVMYDRYTRDNSSVSKMITCVFDSAGFQTSDDSENRMIAKNIYGAHSLRHTFVTIARGHGLPDAYIKGITGHTQDEMVEHYTHFDAKLAEAFHQQLTTSPLGTVPDWIRNRLQDMTGKNWKKIRDEILRQ